MSMRACNPSTMCVWGGRGRVAPVNRGSDERKTCGEEACMKGRTECEHMEKGRRLGGRQQQKSKEAITSDTRIDTHTHKVCTHS